MVELRADPAPATSVSRSPARCATRRSSSPTGYRSSALGRPDGRRFDLDRAAEGRGVRVIERDGEHVAALVHRPRSPTSPSCSTRSARRPRSRSRTAASRSSSKAKLEELAGSRGRVIEAGQEERKRLERNLHDGAQQRLVALSLELGLLGGKLADDPEAQARIDAARGRRSRSRSSELRDVARGLHPAVLSGHGLEVALESLAATSARAGDARGRGRRAAQGAGRGRRLLRRHREPRQRRQARRGRVGHASTSPASNGELVVEIVDDGVGGADTERGSGLRGLADRVEALGGRLRVWTPAGGGTRVRAEMPCG